MNTALAAVSVGIVTAAGGVITWSVVPTTRPKSKRLLTALALSPLVGHGVLSLQVFWWRCLDLQPPRLLSFLGLAAVLTIGGLLLNTRGTDHAPRSTSSRPSIVWRLVELGTAICAVIAGVAAWHAFRVITTAWPNGGWDAVAIWNLKAKLLVSDYWHFADALRAVSPAMLPAYPLLVPGALAGDCFLLGADLRAVAPLLHLACVAGLAALVFEIVLERANRPSAFLALAFVITGQLIWTWGFAEVADVWVAYAFLASFAGLGSLLNETPAALPPLVTGACLGWLIWSKNEGVILAAGLCALFAIAARQSGMSRRRFLGSTVAMLVTVLPSLSALVVFKTRWVPNSGLSTFFRPGWEATVLEVSRWQHPAAAIAARLLPWSQSYGWAWVWPGLVAGVVLAIVMAGRQTWTRYWAATIVFTALSWIAFYVVTPYDQQWHIASSLDRLMIQAYPLVIVGAFATLGRIMIPLPAASVEAAALRSR